jgi:hypothetical protein
MLSHDVAHVLRLIQRDGAGRRVASYLHTHELGEVTQVLDFEYGRRVVL